MKDNSPTRPAASDHDRRRKVLAAVGISLAGAVIAGLGLLASGGVTPKDRPSDSHPCGTPRYVGQRCTEVTENAIATFTRELTAQVSPVTKTNLMFAAQSDFEVIKAKKTSPPVADLCAIAYAASPGYEHMVPNAWERTKKTFCDPAAQAKKNDKPRECSNSLVRLFRSTGANPKELPDFTHGVIGRACGLKVDKTLENKHVGV